MVMCRRLFKFSGKKPSEVAVAQPKEKSIQGNTPQGVLHLKAGDIRERIVNFKNGDRYKIVERILEINDRYIKCRPISGVKC